MKRRTIIFCLVLGVPFFYFIGISLYLAEEVKYGLHSYRRCDQKLDVDHWRICLHQDIYEDSLGGYYTEIQLGQTWKAGLYRHFGGGAGEGAKFTFEDTRSKKVKLDFKDGVATVAVDDKIYRFKVPEDFIRRSAF